MYQNTYSRNFIITLALLPAIVQAVIMIVNGNLGTGVAVMGAFSLVRFRSVPGNSREIGSVFLSMAVGLAAGMGYLGLAALLTLVIGLASVLLVSLPVGRGSMNGRELKVTIPENLDYTGIFDDIFAKYTGRAQLLRVKTVNMGSLYELCYRVELKNERIDVYKRQLLTSEQIPAKITNWMIGLTDNKYLLLLLINILLLITGMFIDSGPAIMLLAPILCPVATSLGVDLVQFGLVMVINLTIGLLTPPVGTAMYVGSNVSGVPIPQISRALLPFIAIMLGVLMIVTYVPAFTGWAY